MNFIRLAAIAAIVSSAVACTTTRIHRLSDEELVPVQPSEVQLFSDRPEYSYEVLAYIDSSASTSRSDETRRDQMEELRQEAGRLGANAVVEIQPLEEKHRGLIPDPRTPFKSWQPGEYELHFMRGKAVLLGTQPNKEGDSAEEEEPSDSLTAETRFLPMPPLAREAEIAPPRPGY